MSTVLSSIKTQLGVAEDDSNFDTDLVIFINDALFDVKMLGPGKPGVTLKINTETEWSELFDDSETSSAVEEFIYLTVKLVFDPPQTSYGIAAIERKIKKKSWMLTVAEDEDGGYTYE